MSGIKLSVNENLTKDGWNIVCEWTNTPLQHPNGTVLGVIAMVQDITGRKRTEEEIRKLNQELSLVMLDIDHFKAYNDNYGHVSGDICLQRIARVIAESAVRAADIAARYGGEEFTDATANNLLC